MTFHFFMATYSSPICSCMTYFIHLLGLALHNTVNLFRLALHTAAMLERELQMAALLG